MQFSLKNVFTTENTESTEKDLAKAFVMKERLIQLCVSHSDYLSLCSLWFIFTNVGRR